MPLRASALDPTTVEPRSHSGYPEPFRARVLPRFGVNLTRLAPGRG
jgi:hypothetical protein